MHFSNMKPVIKLCKYRITAKSKHFKCFMHILLHSACVVLGMISLQEEGRKVLSMYESGGNLLQYSSKKVYEDFICF